MTDLQTQMKHASLDAENHEALPPITVDVPSSNAFPLAIAAGAGAVLPSSSLLGDVASRSVRLPWKLRRYKPFLRRLCRAVGQETFLEQLRRLRDAVLLTALNRQDASRGASVALVGARGREGTSLLALSLGLILGECGQRKVAIVDGAFDERRFSALSHHFGLVQDSLSIPVGSRSLEAFANRAFPATNFLHGSAFSGSAQFFFDKNLKGCWPELCRDFDFTVIDMPPLLKDGSSVFALPFVDSVYLVVEAGRTAQADVSRCAACIGQAGGKFGGFVLNKQRVPLWSRFFWREFFYGQ